MLIYLTVLTVAAEESSESMHDFFEELEQQDQFANKPVENLQSNETDSLNGSQAEVIEPLIGDSADAQIEYADETTENQELTQDIERGIIQVPATVIDDAFERVDEFPLVETTDTDSSHQIDEEISNEEPQLIETVTETEKETSDESSSETPQPLKGVESFNEIDVYGEKTQLPGFQIDRTQSSTKITIEEIKRRNPIDVMELIEDIPGISAVGGVRGGSKGFNIRGFSDNEDILTIIDGARQNFERYRSGSEIDIEPSLLQEIEVIRGSNVRYGGAGTLGGAVIMKTKNARDLLEPGEEAGIEFRTGYFTNNNQKKGGFTAFAQPVNFADLLFNITKDSSNDITQADNVRLPDSATKKLSSLIKLGFFGDTYDLDLGYRLSDQAVLEPFNQFENANSSFGFIRREKTTRSPTANFNWDPESDLVNIKGSYAYNDQLVVDLESPLASGGIDRVGYKILNIELLNTSTFTLGTFDWEIDIGSQFSRERRSYIRELPDGTADFNPAQPPGEKLSYGAFLDSRLSWHNITMDFGIRYDEYEVTAGGEAEQDLINQGNDPTNTFDALNFAAGLSYQPRSGPFTLFYNYKQSFSVPLIDQLFAQQGTGNCDTFSNFIQSDDPSRPTIIDFIFEPDPTAALIRATEEFENQPFYVDNATCSGFYEPETSNTHEIGFSMNWDNLFRSDGTINSKLTYYQIRTDNILESIFQNTVTNEVSQPGKEFREGFEIEFSYDSKTWFSNLSISTLKGFVDFNFFENNSFFESQPGLTPEDIRALDTGKIDLFNVPANSLSFSLGYKIEREGIELGYRLRAVDNRTVTTGINTTIISACGTQTTLSLPVCNNFANQPGYTLHNLFASWQPQKAVRVGLTMTNITNKLYFTDGFGGGQGNIAPGRDLRLIVDWRF